MKWCEEVRVLMRVLRAEPEPYVDMGDYVLATAYLVSKGFVEATADEAGRTILKLTERGRSLARMVRDDPSEGAWTPT